jgi:hypothetical protein
MAVDPSQTSLAALLNRRPYHDRLRQHWSQTFVRDLTEELASADPLGLCADGAPPDEYEPEALLAIAMLFGLHRIEQLWPLRPADAARRLRSACNVENALRAAFTELFFEGAGHAFLSGLGADVIAGLSRHLEGERCAPFEPGL